MHRLTLAAALSIALCAPSLASAQDPCAGLLDGPKARKTRKAKKASRKVAPKGDPAAACRAHLMSRKATLTRSARAKTQAVAQAITFRPVASGQLSDSATLPFYLQAISKGDCRLELRERWSSVRPFGFRQGSSWSTVKHDQFQGHDVSRLDMRRYVPEPHGHSGAASYTFPGANPENYNVRFRDAGASTHSFQFALKVVRRHDESSLPLSTRTQRVQEGISRLNTMRQRWADAVDTCGELDAVRADLARLDGSKSSKSSKSSRR